MKKPARTKSITTALQVGLRLLRQAYESARSLRRPLWDFAVQIETFAAAGITPTDLRALACLGLIDHAVETTGRTDKARTFRQVRNTRYCQRSCFVLSERDQTEAGRCSLTRARKTRRKARRPCWHGEQRELRAGLQIVKKFAQPAASQETVIVAFAEQGFVHEIDDPLPPRPGINPKRRLNRTIDNLNRCQRVPLIHFYATGNGQKVGWKWRVQATSKLR